MKKSWGLIDKIIKGAKIAESRWYKTKKAPWNRITVGDNLYFKDSGEEVKVKADVTKVLQFDNLNPSKRKEILDQYGKDDLGTSDLENQIREYTKDKKYCIIVYFENVRILKSFKIDKTGYGAMSAWIVVDNINKIKI
ncbi:hypothetical protein GF362_02225 [Candidatus Dojkabacteria bacterium]|nr:hypothetical protein [Candidatus Dojkabacteria bacterium]